MCVYNIIIEKKKLQGTRVRSETKTHCGIPAEYRVAITKIK